MDFIILELGCLGLLLNFLDSVFIAVGSVFSGEFLIDCVL